MIRTVEGTATATGRTFLRFRAVVPTMSTDTESATGLAPRRNVGGRDRKARGVLGVLLGNVAVLALGFNRRNQATIVGVAAAGLLFNAVVGFCGLNAMLGIDTCQRNVD